MSIAKKIDLSDYFFKQILRELASIGKFSSPRGLKIIEIENYVYKLPPYVRFCNFDRRKLHIAYIKEEFKWYLRGDKFDNSICEHAPIWLETVNQDGSFNSNYGQYIFGEINQFEKALESLKKDKDSRRAAIMILSKDHLLSETKDVPCTYCISFRIRDNFLNMTVRMRSQDAIFGMGNDCACFSFIHELMYNLLKEYYPNLEYGLYYHSADSFHAYEKQFKMIEDITRTPIIRDINDIEFNDKYTFVDCPEISGPEEAKFLLNHNFAIIPDTFYFSKWLCNKENK